VPEKAQGIRQSSLRDQPPRLRSESALRYADMIRESDSRDIGKETFEQRPVAAFLP